MLLKNKYNLVEVNENVFYLKDQIFEIKEIGGDLENYCKENDLLKGRICFHKDADDPLQRMIIYHSKFYKVPIHYHQHKEETLIVLKGACSYREYSIKMNKYNKNDFILEKEIDIKPMELINIKKGVYHNLHIKTDIVFMEFSPGPFNEESTIFA